MQAIEVYEKKGALECHEWLSSRSSDESQYANLVTGVEYKIEPNSEYALLFAEGEWKKSLHTAEELVSLRNVVNLNELQKLVNDYFYDGQSVEDVAKEHQAYGEEIIEGGVKFIVGESIKQKIRGLAND